MDASLDNPTINGSIIIEGNVFKDIRGSFRRIFDDRKLSNIFFDGVKNINISRNILKGTLRGLHMQTGIYAETKIVFCGRGSLIDLFVDCRKESSTFGIINKVYLDEYNNKTLLVPRGCLHSFLTLSENTEVIYSADNYYSPENEISVSPFSKGIFEQFEPHEIKICSDKDKNGIQFSNFIEKLKSTNY